MNEAVQNPMSSIDPSKIKGPYQLLAAFLIAADSIFSICIARSENYIERIVFGIFILISFLAFLYIVLKISTQQDMTTLSLRI